jgi:Tfp pilus assembly protein PilN
MAWQKLAGDKAALDAINDESKDIKTKMNMIADMTTKKSVLWSPKFNAISDALPRGLWIRNMTLDKTGLSIEGSVVSKTRNEINNVGLFISALKQDNDFIKDFSSLEVNSIQRSNASSVEVADFTILAKSNETRSK